MTKIIIRRYVRDDIPIIIQWIVTHITGDGRDYDNYYKDLDVNEDKLYKYLIQHLHDPDCFGNLILKDEEIVGGLYAHISEPVFSSRRIAYDQMLYVVPTFHSVKAVLRLVQSYIDWSERRGAVECRLENSSGYNQRGFGALCKRLHFVHFREGYARRF